MTPLPKNKITRAERGKRRAGNTPKLLKKNAATAKIPLHKDKMVQKLRLILSPVKKMSETEAKSQLAAKMATKKPATKKAKPAAKSASSAKKATSSKK
ncbi:hypothetical protein IJJ12_00120 [bacterium]|nr:hypothetical protein [bacterium]